MLIAFIPIRKTGKGDIFLNPETIYDLKNPKSSAHTRILLPKFDITKYNRKIVQVIRPIKYMTRK